MSHFYGTIQGNRGEATRCGAKGSGYEATAAGWQGAVRTILWYDEQLNQDMYKVYLVPWGCSGGETKVLAEGILDSTKQVKSIVTLSNNVRS